MTKQQSVDLFVVRVIAYYDFKGEMDNGNIHPKVNDMKEFINKNLNTTAQFQEFWKKMIEQCKYFPNHVELSAIYNGLKSISIPMQKLEIEMDVFPVTPSEGNENATIEQVIKNNRFLSSKDLLKKYGRALCEKAWFRIGQEMKDGTYELFISHVRSKEFNAAFNVNRSRIV